MGSNPQNPANATPVYIAPAPGAESYNIPNLGNYQIHDGAGFVSSVGVNTASDVVGATIALYDGEPGEGGVLLGTFSFTALGVVPVAIPFADSLWAQAQPAPGAGDATVVFVPIA